MAQQFSKVPRDLLSCRRDVMQIYSVLMMQDDFTETVQPVSPHDFMLAFHL